MISALKVHAAVRLTDQPPEPTPPCPEHGRRAAPRPRRRVFAASPAPPSTLPAPVVPPPAPPSTATPSNTTPSTHRACPSPERDKRSESSSITNTSPNKTTPPAPDTGGAAAQIMKREGPFTLSASGQPSSEQESRKAPAKLIGGGAAAQNPKSKIQNPNVPASADKSAQVSAKPESSSSQAKRPGLNCPRALYPYSHYLQARREGRSTNKRYMPPLPSEHSPFQELTTTPPPSEHLRETCDNTCGTTAEAPSFPSRTAPTSLRPPRPDS
jgi:hypothetical protein